MKEIKKSNLALRVAKIFESVLATVVLFAVLLGSIDVIRMIWDAYIIDFKNPVGYSQLNDILAQILLLVIAVELVVMLSLHIPGAIVEVLLYAIARKMLLLPKSGGMSEILFGVVAIAGIFAIKKYLTIKESGNIDITSIYHGTDELFNKKQEETNDNYSEYDKNF